MLVLLSIAFFVDSDLLAWRLCGITLVCTICLFVGDIWLDLKKCRHPHLFFSKWLDWDGTPGVSKLCPDCGFSEHVYVKADPETWLKP